MHRRNLRADTPNNHRTDHLLGPFAPANTAIADDFYY